MFSFLKYTAIAPGFVPCVHNPVGRSLISKAHMRQIVPLVICFDLQATALVPLLPEETQIEVRQLLLDPRSAGFSWDPPDKNSSMLNSPGHGPSGIEGHPSQEEDGSGNRC